MTEPTIRDEWVEKAARAAFDDGLMRHAPEHVARWDDEHDEGVRESWRVVASAALMAVADDIRADLLESGELRLYRVSGDAEFIAVSRTAMPALLTAVRAVLDLHDPREGEWSCGNPVHTNPDIGCPDCGLACRTCGESVPCPEWLAVTDALGGGS